MAIYNIPVGEIHLKFLQEYNIPASPVNFLFKTNDYTLANDFVYLNLSINNSEVEQLNEIINDNFSANFSVNQVEVIQEKDIYNANININVLVPDVNIEQLNEISIENIHIEAEIDSSEIEQLNEITNEQANLNLAINNVEVEQYNEIINDNLIVNSEIFPNTVGQLNEITNDNFDIVFAVSSVTVDYFTIVSNDSVTIALSIKSEDLGVVKQDHIIWQLPEILSDNVDVLSISDSIFKGGLNHNLPTKQGTGYHCSWSNTMAEKQTLKWNIWGDFVPEDIFKNIPYKTKPLTDNLSVLNWLSFIILKDQHIKVLWADLVKTLDSIFSVDYRSFIPITDIFQNKLWGNFENSLTSLILSIPYSFPPITDLNFSFLWDQFEKAIATFFSFLFDFPEDHNRLHTAYWGQYWYSLFCDDEYFAPVKDTLLYFEPSIAKFEKFEFITPKKPRDQRCPSSQEFTGVRDPIVPYLIDYNKIPHIIPNLKVYYMQNTAIIRRISGNMESIAFSNVSISIDVSSWSWSFNITVLNQASLDLIKPSKDVLQDVEININGCIWTCRVEAWSENISFGQKSWSVTGRSQSIEIASPYNMPMNYTNVADMQAINLVQEILLNTGWEAVWDRTDGFDPLVNWLIPANTFNVADTDKLKAIQSIASAIGYFINTAPNTEPLTQGEKKLYFKPKFPETAWKIKDETPLIQLTENFCKAIGRQSKISAPRNNIIVSGEANGVIINATRESSAGDLSAPIIIDSLITTREAGLERAKNEISQYGYWIQHNLNLFSIGGQYATFNILMPGTIIKMDNDQVASWNGLTQSLQVNAAWSDSGLEVTQTIILDQYYE